MSLIPVVFLHGFLGHPSDWDSTLAYLPPCLSHCIELPGHGVSPFVKNFQIKVPYKKFHLIGYSMGGRLAMQYAMRFPEKILSLTILSAHPGLKTTKEKQERLQLDKKWAQKLSTLSIDEFLSQWYDQPLFQSFKPDFLMRRNHQIKELTSALLHYSLAHQVFHKPKQALYVVGEKDEKYRCIYPEAHIIPEAGHMIHLQNPKAVAKVIEQRIFS